MGKIIHKGCSVTQFNHTLKRSSTFFIFFYFFSIHTFFHKARKFFLLLCIDHVSKFFLYYESQSGGPDYKIPLGRRDGLTFASRQATLENLPPPSSNTTTILNSLATKNLDPTDVVSLSGGHTIGISHCSSFTNRLYPSQDPVMDQTFGKNLRLTCPTNTTDNTTVLDIRSPNTFDNRYYVDLMNRQGLFTSDQDLYTDRRTRGIVTSFAVNQSLFFEKFVFAMLKMGQLNVLTGNQGEIRANCSVRNANRKASLTSFVENVAQEFIEM